MNLPKFHRKIMGLVLVALILSACGTPPQYYDQGMADLTAKGAGRDLKGAVENFKEAIKEDPTNVKAYNALGVTYVLLEEYENAGMNFQNALLLNPDYIPARENLKHLDAGEYDLATEIEY
jgi:Tfp pilus assembly protein PilF